MTFKPFLVTLVLLFLPGSGLSAGALVDPVLGDPDAPVTIIEFASLSCPHCAAFHKERFPWLKKNFIDTGKVRFIFRDFPLNRPALLGAMVARCAEPHQYFAYLGLLFERQEHWAFTEPTEKGLALLAQLAGMGRARFDSCLRDEELADQIIQSRLDSQNQYDIESTPSFAVGKKLITGIPSEETLADLIAAASQ